MFDRNLEGKQPVEAKANPFVKWIEEAPNRAAHGCREMLGCRSTGYSGHYKRPIVMAARSLPKWQCQIAQMVWGTTYSPEPLWKTNLMESQLAPCTVQCKV